MIEFRNVTYKYHYDEFFVLENTSFDVCDGINTLLCNYQSGKTTICKLILGLLRPQHGVVTVDDSAPSSKNPPDVLYLPQNPVFFQNRSALFNLGYPARVRKISPQRDIFQLAERFSLGDLNRKVKTLSPKERLRLALARGLTVPRKIVLFDGFFDNTNQDVRDEKFNARAILSEIADVADFQTTVVLSASPQNAVGRTVVLDGKQAVFVFSEASGLG